MGWDWFYVGNKLQKTQPNQISANTLILDYSEYSSYLPESSLLLDHYVPMCVCFFLRLHLFIYLF